MPADRIRDILTIAAPAAIVIGTIIAIMQLRNQTRLRQIDTVMGLFASFSDETFLRHYLRVTEWKYKTYTAFQKKATNQDYISLYVVSSFFENMGLLYKRKLASLDLLDDLLSGPVIIAWESTRSIWIGIREEQTKPQMAEWFELLYVAMERRLSKLNP